MELHPAIKEWLELWQELPDGFQFKPDVWVIILNLVLSWMPDGCYLLIEEGNKKVRVNLVQDKPERIWRKGG